jgi:tol-pal system protein YbgF
MRTPLLAVVLTACLPLAAAAQNRAELQMNADLRMLQEQVSRLQLTSNQLTEQIKTISRRLDDQSATGQKQVADLRLLINSLAATVNTVREKLDDNTVRVSQLMQELPAMRSGLSMLATQLNTLVGLLQPPVNPTDPNAGPGGAPGPLGAVQIPDSPNALYEAAMGDYTGNRLPLAIEGFTEYVTKFPDSPNAADAQFWIGMAFFNQGRFKEAIDAYDRVIQRYKTSERVPEAYYQQGLSYANLGQRVQATRIFQQIVKQFPGSTSAIMAQQRLTPAR